MSKWQLAKLIFGYTTENYFDYNGQRYLFIDAYREDGSGSSFNVLVRTAQGKNEYLYIRTTD